MASQAASLALLIAGKNETGPTFQAVQRDLRRMQEAMGDRTAAKAIQTEIVRIGEAFKTAGTAAEKAALRTKLQGLQADLKGLRASTDHASEGFGSLMSQGAKLGLGVVGVVGLVGAVTKLGGSMTDAIGNASHLNETISKTNVTFGAAAGQMLDFGDKASSSIGQSKTQALDAAANFGAMFKTVGFGTQTVADMSVEMVKLGSDMASMRDIGVDVALEKIRAGLAGEAEPLRTMGVLLSETAVKAKGLEMGLAGASGELSEGAKVQARYALILEQTRDMQGDFARTSGNLANQQRILAAETAKLSAELGTALLPMATAATKQLVEMVKEINNLAKFTSGLRDRSAEYVKQGGKVEDLHLAMIMGVQELAPGFNDLAVAEKEAADAAQGFADAGDNAVGAMARLASQLPDTAAAARDATAAFREMQAVRAVGIASALASASNPDVRYDAFEEERFKRRVQQGQDLTEQWQDQLRELETGATRAASAAVDSFESASKTARDLGRDIDSEVGAAMIRVANIGQSAGDRWIERWGDVDRSIRDAQRSAEDAIRSMEQSEILGGSITARRKAVDDRIAGERRVFNEQMDDTEYHHREEKAKADALRQYQQALDKASNGDERRAAEERYRETLENLQQAHLDYDAEVQWQIQQQAKRAAMEREWERQRADLERGLHEEELNRQRAAIVEQREKRITAINDEWLAWQKMESDKTKANILDAKDRAAGQLTALKTEFFDKLANAAGPGIAALRAVIEAQLGTALLAVGGGGDGGGGMTPVITPIVPAPPGALPPGPPPPGTVRITPVVPVVTPLTPTSYAASAQQRPILNVIQVDGRTIATIVTTEQGYARSIG